MIFNGSESEVVKPFFVLSKICVKLCYAALNLNR